MLATLAVLAALLLPVFFAGRRSAQKAVCLENLHQIGLALLLYTEDYDSTFPSYTVNPCLAQKEDDLLSWHDLFCRAQTASHTGQSWAQLALPYTLTSLYSLQNNDSPLFCPADPDRKTRPITSYEFKMFLSEGVRLGNVPFPSDTAMVWEQWDFHNPGHYSEYDSRAHLNTVFVDGHARSVWLAHTTSALYGEGPNLHWTFVGQGRGAPYSGRDVYP